MNILKNRSIVLLFLAFTFVLPSMAWSLRVKQPSVKKFVNITADGVNLRRLPDATSGKLMNWYSDGGSIDTYNKIFFSDTEGSRYRANNNTGAFTDVFHPMKGNFYMVSDKQTEPKNGWYQIFVTSESYAGNPDNSNSKFAWVKSTFCQVYDVNENDNDVLHMKIPSYIMYNPETGENEEGKGIGYVETLSRNTGKYAKVHIRTEFSKDMNAMQVTLMQRVNGFIYVSRCMVEIEYGVSQSSKVALKVETVESDMEDADDAIILKASLKGRKTTLTAVELSQYLMTCSDDEFAKVMDILAPNGNLPTDEVYFCDKTGKSHLFGYDATALAGYASLIYNIAVSK